MHESGFKPPSIAEAMDDLRAQLFVGDDQVYVMVDPLLGVHWQRPWSAPQSSAVGVEEILPLDRFGIVKASSPFIVPLENSRSLLLDDSFHIALRENANPQGPRSVCGWFSTPLDACQARVRLHTQVQRRNGRQEWLMRFYDPRTLRHLPAILGPSFAISGVRRWFWIGEDARVTHVEGAPNCAEPFPVRDEHLPVLDRVGVVNQAHAQWQQLIVPLPNDAFTNLFDAAAQAIRHGLSLEQPADCIAFMLHRCLIHPQIERHPVVAGWLTDAREGRRSYADAAVSSGKDVWDEIKSGCWMGAPQGVRYG